MVLICISLLISDVKNIFHVLVGNLYVVFGKITIQIQGTDTITGKAAAITSWLLPLHLWISVCVGGLLSPRERIIPPTRGIKQRF